jgi:ABC-type branched-subunit amino acid transport system substrate-binding protein
MVDSKSFLLSVGVETRRVALATVAAMLCAVLTLATAQAQGTLPDRIRIGVLGGMTGPASFVGIALQAGAKMAVKEVNDAGGIGGKPVELVIGDTQSDPTASSSEAKRLVFEEKVNGIIGPGISQEAVPAVLVTTQGKVFQISTATTLELSRASAPYHLSMAASADSQSVAMVNYALDTLKVKKIAILNDNGGNSKSALLSIQKLLQARGTQEVAQQEYQYHVTDLAPQLLALRRAAPDVVMFMTVAPEDLRKYIETLRDIGWSVKTLGNVSIPTFAPNVGKQVDPGSFKDILGVVYEGTTYCHEPVGAPLYAKFIKDLHAFAPDVADKSPAASFAFYYVSTQTMLAAMQGAKTTDAAALMSWMEKNAPSLPNAVAKMTGLSPTSHFLWGPDSLVAVADPDKVREDGLFRRSGC